MPYSKLVSVTKLTSHNSGYRTHKVDRITPHHTAGCGPVESVLTWFCNPKCNGSSNYIIGSDGRVALSVDEANRAWTSSSTANDDRAITIEVCNSASGGNWPVSDKAFDTLVLLCTDICQRYNKNKLLYFDKNTALAYQPKDNEMILTRHDWFVQKICPGPYLGSKFPELAQRVTANLNKGVNTSTDIIGKPQEEVVTQEEFNKMAINWLNGLSKENSSLFARDALIWNAKYDILAGDDKNNFMVKKPLTREEFIASMKQLYEVFLTEETS